MNERISPEQTPPEVVAIRTWLDKEIAGKGICPPLIKVLQQHRSDNGSINWDEAAKQIDIESAYTLYPYSPTLLTTVTDSYLRFMEEATYRSGPLTKVIILPDFQQNPHYDAFIREVKFRAFDTLLDTTEGQSLAKIAHLKAATVQGKRWEAENALIRGGKPVQTINTANVIDGVFNPVFFYGREVTDRDTSDIPTTRGPRERYKVLSRAPYYLLQVVNMLHSKSVIGNLDRQKLYRHNTDIAQQTDMPIFERAMRGYRSS